MAYIVSNEKYYLNGSSTNLVVALPPHDTNDIIVLHAAMDSGTCVTGTGTTGTWTSIGNTTATNNTGSCLYRRMTSNAETVSITTTDAYAVWFIVIRDVDTTTALDVTSSFTNNNTATSTPINISVTTTTSDALILYFVGIDGIATQTHSPAGFMSLGSFDSTGTTSTTAAAQGACWYIQRTAGAVPVPTWTASASGTTTLYTIALRNKTSGVIPAYIDDSAAPAVMLAAGNHIGTLNNISFPGTLTSTAAINGKTVNYSAATAGADFGINPYSSAISKSSAVVAATALAGYEIIFTGNRNVTGMIMGSFIAATPKTGTFSVGSTAQGGVVVRIGSSATAWCAYQVAARDSVPTTEQRYVFAIKPGYTGTAYGTPGTAVTITAISHMQFLLNCPSLAALEYMSELYEVRTIVAAGGDSVEPVDTDGMVEIGKSFRLPVIQKSGGYGLVSYAPLQIGGGDAINFQIDAGSLQFPKRYDTLRKELAFHAGDNTVGISYAGKSGDVIKHTNSVVTSPNIYYWEINSAATSAATWDFTGLVIVNATVTLRNVMTFSTMTFSGCPSINASSCALTSCVISKPAAAGSTFTVDASTTVANSTINTTTITAGAPFVQTATPNQFSNTTFVGSATSGHAIQITTAGTYSFNNLKFTGYGGTGGTNLVASSGSTSAAIYNNSGGSVTINVTNNGDTPSVRNGAGASTTVNNAVALSITVVDSSNNPIVGNGTSTGARVAMYKASDKSVIISPTYTNASGVVTGSFAYLADTNIVVRVRLTSVSGSKYIPVDTSGTIKSTGFSTTITMLRDTIAV